MGAAAARPRAATPPAAAIPGHLYERLTGVHRRLCRLDGLTSIGVRVQAETARDELAGVLAAAHPAGGGRADR